ncbi:MAG: segregation/condensation protein A [Caldilineales bacterium]|nr:segregation/condensation protein A [Caldilineales bacterium]MDW8317567.1 segregation/condensation protein A [Anaerolineae bacterium]
MFDQPADRAYQVRLPLFEGPLDLLLHLIERRELDITAISLASVADQFVAYLETMRERGVQARVIADFLVVAARLLVIKSRLLLPQPPPLEEGEEDPGEALVRRLQEYKRFKRAAEWLKARQEAGLRSYVRVAPPVVGEPKLDPTGLSVDALIAALRQLTLEEPDLPSADPLVPPRKITVQEKIERIEALLSDGRPVPFAEVVNGGGSRLEVVVSLWAVLEMIKRGRLQAIQRELFGEITLLPVPGAEASKPAVAVGEQEIV